MSKIKNCPDCKSGPMLQEGCSRVQCPMRKPITARASGSVHFAPSSGDQSAGTGNRVTPTNKEDYDA